MDGVKHYFRNSNYSASVPSSHKLYLCARVSVFSVCVHVFAALTQPLPETGTSNITYGITDVVKLDNIISCPDFSAALSYCKVALKAAVYEKSF